MHHIPSWIPHVMKDITWHKDRSDPTIYLTFDDGPVPGVSDFVLNQLSKKGMKATFFMVGDNVRKHTSLAKEVFSAGHSVGNHTYFHLKGTSTKHWAYLKDTLRCQYCLEDALNFSTKLFRPPYGLMTKTQFDSLKAKFEIVLWDVLSGDYDLKQDAATCLQKSKQYTQAGSIVLFHDQEKTSEKIQKFLPDFLNWVEDQGFQTNSL